MSMTLPSLHQPAVRFGQKDETDEVFFGPGGPANLKAARPDAPRADVGKLSLSGPDTDEVFFGPGGPAAR